MTSLAVDGNVSASIQNQALNAIVFLVLIILSATVRAWFAPRVLHRRLIVAGRRSYAALVSASCSASSRCNEVQPKSARML